jgi:CDP-glucose 4,6-dehydratase
MSEFYRGKRVLVTGHRGFVGTHLTRRLSELGAAVKGVDRVECENVLCSGDLHRTFEDFKPQIVFHLAARTEVRDSYNDPWLTYHTNVTGTLNVLELCRLDKDVESVVIASTDKAYGDQDVVDSNETDYLLGNADIYSLSKKAADELSNSYADLFKLPVKVVRPCNIYGPGQRNETTLITGTIRKLLKGISPVVYRGSKNVLREWLYVDDVIQAYLLLGECKQSGVWNVGSSERVRVENVIRLILKTMNSSIETSYEDGPLQIGDQGISSAKFRAKFPDWKPTPFVLGLSSTVKWYQENQ